MMSSLRLPFPFESSFLPPALTRSFLSFDFRALLRMITFPANLIFTDFGSIGVSMFFMSCIVSQLTYTLGGSIFKGGNGSMMIEAVPFFHIIVGVITAKVGEDKVSFVSSSGLVPLSFSSRDETDLSFSSIFFLRCSALARRRHRYYHGLVRFLCDLDR